MSSKRLNGKKGKREFSNKNKNTFQIVYIFPYPPYSIRIPKVGYIG